jgi:phosphoribosylaminoimidazole-succinocarboxamide synthase
MVEILGDKDLADNIAKSAVALYTKASEYAAEKGIIIADTKFEFGLDENNNLVLVDEVLTPGMY